MDIFNFLVLLPRGWGFRFFSIAGYCYLEVEKYPERNTWIFTERDTGISLIKMSGYRYQDVEKYQGNNTQKLSDLQVSLPGYLSTFWKVYKCPGNDTRNVKKRKEMLKNIREQPGYFQSPGIITQKFLWKITNFVNISVKTKICL